MVFILCLINLWYYIPDILFVFDVKAPPVGYFLSHEMDDSSKVSIFYLLFREVRYPERLAGLTPTHLCEWVVVET